MKREIFLLTYLLIYVLFLGSCSYPNRDSYILKREDFNVFYKRFYSDSTFQKSRIDFPLKGTHIEYIDYELMPKEFTNWKESEWIFLGNIFSGNDTVVIIGRNEFKRHISKTDSIVYENIVMEDSGFESTSRFILKNEIWYLVEYNEVNY